MNELHATLDEFRHRALMTTCYLPDALSFAAQLRAGPVMQWPLYYYALGKVVASNLGDKKLLQLIPDYASTVTDTIVSTPEDALYKYCIAKGGHDILPLIHLHGHTGFFMATRVFEYGYESDDIALMEAAVERMQNGNGVEALMMDPNWERILYEVSLQYKVSGETKLDRERLDHCMKTLPGRFRSRGFLDRGRLHHKIPLA